MLKITKANDTILAAALELNATRGWAIFPARFKQENGKWQKLSWKSAKSSNGRAWGMTTDPDEIRRDFAKPNRTAIGLPTGAINGIFVIETDTPEGHDIDGAAALRALEAEHGALPETLRAVSPSGSLHRYYKHPGNSIKVGCTTSTLGPGIDVKGDGGMVIAPPSLRPGKGAYRWVNDALITDAPDWLIALVTAEPEGVQGEPSEEREAPLWKVAAALAVIPNPPDLEWGEWKRIGMAVWAATGGSDDGFKAFDDWSKKWVNYDSGGTRKAWQEIDRSPPTEIGAGTLFYEANEAEPDWQKRAVTAMRFPDVTEKGKLRATLPNTKLALGQLGVKCRHDLFKLRYLVDGHEIENFVGDVSDPALLRLREIIYERFSFDPTTETVHTAVMTLANHHRFHPVRDYLDGLRWDGTPRIESWLINYGGAKDNQYTRVVGALVLVAAVRRVRTPGCKFDEMLVLDNPEQGTNKSTALQVLAVEREWFSDNLPLGLNGKETIEALSGHWILEVSELQGLKKSDIEKVKAFLSRDTDRARMAYARTVTEARRQCVIIGTTNSDKYLRDLTGNRRIWPVRVERFNLEALKRDRDQLWAEAAAREASGASIRLPEPLWAVAAAEQHERVIDNPFLSVLDRALREMEISEPAVLDDKGRTLKPAKRVPGHLMSGKIAAEDVWTLLGIRPGQRHQDHNEKLGAAMVDLGWKRTRLRIDGELSYSYVRGDEPYRRIVVYPGDKEGPATASYEPEGQPLF